MLRARRGGVGAIGALALALACAGCGGKGIAGSTWHDTHPLPQDTLTVPTAEIGTYGGRFVLAQTVAPKTFNAMMANETSSTDVTQRLFMALTDYDNITQQTRPGIAKSWEKSADGLTWTWHLRRDAKFSDGHPITSADVLFNFEVAYDTTLHPSVQDLLIIGGRKMEVTAPDSYTVVTKIAKPYVLMEGAIGSVYIMPKHILEAAYRRGDFASTYATSARPESIVTSGAWTVKQYVPGEKTVLTRNPYWYGVDAEGHRLPYLDELVYLLVPDQNTAALRFQSGGVDALDDIKPEDYQRYTEGQQKGDYTLYDLGPSLNTNFMWFNLNKVRTRTPGKTLGAPYMDPVKYSWFSNPDFRRAVSMAIDRDAIIRSVYFGQAVKNWSTITPGNKVWYTPDVKTWDYDPEAAKALLAKAGFKDTNGDSVLEDPHGHPVSFTLKTNTSNALRIGMTVLIKDDLARVGIRCNPAPVEFNTLITNLRQDFDYEAMLLGLQSGVPPDPVMGQNVWRSSGLTHYWNIKQPHPETAAEAEADRLFEENISTLDMKKRLDTWRGVQNAINQECFVIWLPTLKWKVPIRNHFGNLQPSVIPHHFIWNIDRVFYRPRARA